MQLLLIGAFFAIFSNVHGNSSYVKKLPFNITGKWYLPNSNSPVFYLHFRDRISWVEADAVCQFHHSQLVTINTKTQFEDMKSYLKEIDYDKKVWIGLQKLYNESMEWRDGTVLSTDEYWKEPPTTERSICVMASPADNYLWIANPCNGPGTASFICEMPIPKWVKKSACLDAVNPSITVTFHPEKTMIKAGTVCQNSDIKYIECHDPQGINEKVEENKKMIREHLICPSQSNEQPMSQNITVKSTTAKATKLPSSTSRPSTSPQSTMKKLQRNISTPITPTPKVSSTQELKSTTGKVILKKTSPIVNIELESSTVSLPQEMSFAEEPIRASKPFVEKDPTETPDVKYAPTNTTENAQFKGNSKAAGFNLIPTSRPLKNRAEKTTLLATELPKENASVSIYAILGATDLSSNATPVEESHEVYNNDKDREIFQDSVSPPVKKSVKLEIAENVGNSLKNIVSKSSESEEDQSGDRTYNIEGTFDSNDFSNIEPINVYKKIDINPMENVAQIVTTVKPTENDMEKLSSTVFPNPSVSSKLQIKSQTSQSILVSQPLETTVVKNSTPSIVNLSTTDSSQQISTTIQNLIILEPRNDSISSLDEIEGSRKRSPLLSGAEDNENEKNYPSRKRHIINSERHSFYPYFLGRIWG